MKTGIVSLTRQAVPLVLALRLVTLTTPGSLAVAATVPVEVQRTQVAVAAPAAPTELSPARFLIETNAARTEQGLPSLALNETLNAAAARKAADMVAAGYWDHFRPSDNKAPWDFMKESGYDYSVAGENLARGFKTAAGITAAWMASPTHRANLLSEKYDEVGFAVVEGLDENGEPALITVQFFGSR